MFSCGLSSSVMATRVLSPTASRIFFATATLSNVAFSVPSTACPPAFRRSAYSVTCARSGGLSTRVTTCVLRTETGPLSRI